MLWEMIPGNIFVCRSNTKGSCLANRTPTALGAGRSLQGGCGVPPPVVAEPSYIPGVCAVLEQPVSLRGSGGHSEHLGVTYMLFIFERREMGLESWTGLSCDRSHGNAQGPLNQPLLLCTEGGWNPAA